MEELERYRSFVHECGYEHGGRYVDMLGNTDYETGDIYYGRYKVVTTMDEFMEAAGFKTERTAVKMYKQLIKHGLLTRDFKMTNINRRQYDMIRNLICFLSKGDN